MGLFVCMNSCGKPTNLEKVSDLAYDSHKNRENIVYLLENDEYVPYLVLTNDYDGKTLLLRKEVLPDAMRISEYYSYYEKSEIDCFLNEVFLNELGDLQSIIQLSNIDITCDESIGYSDTEKMSISRKVFLLSCTELNIESEANQAKEGKCLKYFKDINNRKTYSDGEATSWWLRTPNTYYLSCTFSIGFDGTIGTGNSSDLNGIRPAFCVDPNQRIELIDNIYILKS